uniref:Uncharacterized protein n=1 Tax=Anguilla anguilla TaxID=7936 RepID=A0A0E9W8P9_ANGAN
MRTHEILIELVFIFLVSNLLLLLILVKLLLVLKYESPC